MHVAVLLLVCSALDQAMYPSTLPRPPRLSAQPVTVSVLATAFRSVVGPGPTPSTTLVSNCCN
jgi:hypothetical protein